MHTTHIFTTLDSTNRTAFELAQLGAEHGTAVLAEMQVKGRGRLDRSWHSPANSGLYCSIIIRPKIPAEVYPKITLVAGLSVAKALDCFCGCTVSVKWPNDIYLSGKKLGGILTEAAPFACSPTNAFAVVGVGVNINNKIDDFPQEIAGKATSIFLEVGREYEIQTIFQSIRDDFLDDICRLEKYGFSQILAEWKMRHMLQDHRVRWYRQNGKVVNGRCRGPDAEGRLVIEDELGQFHHVVSGDVLLQEPLIRDDN